MDLKTSRVIFLLISITSTWRIVASGRLHAESEIGLSYCDYKNTFTNAFEGIAKAVQRRYSPHEYAMVCGGKYTVGPGVIVKETKVPFAEAGEPDHCTFKIQAPEGFRVYVYHYRYDWASEICIDHKDQAAGVANFYDGKLEGESLLYSPEKRSRRDVRIISTGRDLLIDVVQHGKDCRCINEEKFHFLTPKGCHCFSELTKYQKITIKYAFVKRDENGKITLLDDKKKP